jgi:hypothetical protein
MDDEYFTFNVEVPKKTVIYVDGFDGFEIIAPNGTDVRKINEFLGKALDFTAKIIQEMNAANESRP